MNNSNDSKYSGYLRGYNMKLDYSQITDIKVDGINTNDYPDFCDAFISSANYLGREMNDTELDLLNDDRDFVHNAVYNFYY